MERLMESFPSARGFSIGRQPSVLRNHRQVGGACRTWAPSRLPSSTPGGHDIRDLGYHGLTRIPRLDHSGPLMWLSLGRPQQAHPHTRPFHENPLPHDSRRSICETVRFSLRLKGKLVLDVPPIGANGPVQA